MGTGQIAKRPLSIIDPSPHFPRWMSKAAGRSACDFTFHMGVTKYDSAIEAQLHEDREIGNQEDISARQRGARVSVETLIQYLLLDKTYASAPSLTERNS